LRSSDHESCDSWHAPSNAHAYRLLIVKEHRSAFAFCVAVSDQRRPRFSYFFQSPVKHLVFACSLSETFRSLQRCRGGVRCAISTASDYSTRLTEVVKRAGARRLGADCSRPRRDRRCSAHRPTGPAAHGSRPAAPAA